MSDIDEFDKRFQTHEGRNTYDFRFVTIFNIYLEVKEKEFSENLFVHGDNQVTLRWHKCIQVVTLYYLGLFKYKFYDTKS